MTPGLEICNSIIASGAGIYRMDYKCWATSEVRSRVGLGFGYRLA